ncbi:molybdopterin-dependent oxidoreductase [Paracidovorax avenae]|uniref:molybdopterin-dependent oxidoreductase n=1 Tax=Paracidovorax avenae TaxID=80867 RepID=UPI000D20C1EA|nr:molybdopterin-dependent oxidoreductase [Paracidovorax avenae]AVS79526.1 molybdopterin-dependent oxidoreductase [Paracidovorax avenae]
MRKRSFLTHLGLAGMLPAGSALAHAPALPQPALLTVAGAIQQPNRGALNPTADLLAAKQGVQFSQARSFDAAALQHLPAVSITPTLEYDGQRHTLEGPLLSTVLAAAGAPTQGSATVVLRAVDGYNASLTVADADRYRMIVALRMDGAPLPLGGLGPQWAVYDADNLPQFKNKPLKERFALAPWGLYLIEVR